jgi:hypothetical protein
MGTGARAEAAATGQLLAQDKDYLAQLKAEQDQYNFGAILADQVRQLGDLNMQLYDKVNNGDSLYYDIQQISPTPAPTSTGNNKIIWYIIGGIGLWLLLRSRK